MYIIRALEHIEGNGKSSDQVKITATFVDDTITLYRCVESVFKCPYQIGQEIKLKIVGEK